MAAQLAQLARLQKMVASILVANPDDMSYVVATLTDQQKYSPDHITDSVLYIDLEVCRSIQDTIGHGFRSQYAAVQAVAYGASILPHPGHIGVVEIKQLTGDPFERGIKVRSVHQILKYRTNPDSMYGADASIHGGRYYIDEEDKLYFTGFSAQVVTPNDLAITVACQAPAVYEPAIARGAVMMLAKDPLDPSLFNFYGQQYQADLARIKNLEVAIPPLDMFVKAGG